MLVGIHIISESTDIYRYICIYIYIHIHICHITMATMVPVMVHLPDTKCVCIYIMIYIYTNIVVRYLWSYIIMYQFNNNYVTDSKLYHVRL